MSKSRYSPRLKKSIFGEKSYLITSKDLTRLRKKKWAFFLRNRSKMSSLLRNDVFLMHNKVQDLRKNYKNGLIQKQKFFAFFSNLKKASFRKLLKCPRRNLIRNFSNRVELRLDLALFRANFVNSLYNARAFVYQKEVFVNGFCVLSPAYLLRVGDIVELKGNLGNSLFSEVSFNFPVSFLEVNYEIATFIVLKKPCDDSFNVIYAYDKVFYNLFEIKNFALR